MKNISETGKCCSGCGICVSVCPVGAIHMENRDGFLEPVINSQCINCGKCLAICPAGKADECTYHFFSEKRWGHSCNETIRREAASGGLTSELLHYLISSKTVDYVITADHYKNDRSCGICMPKDDSIYEKAGSRYCPVDMSDVISKIRDTEGTCAIVCLPCYARGIRRLMDMDSSLNKKVKYIISLLCNHVPSYHATEYLIKKYKTGEADEIRYRGDGWFGHFRTYKNGKLIHSISFSEYFPTAFSRSFWRYSCILCKDHFGKSADICMGDADFIKHRFPEKENLGETFCFINNPALKNILEHMEKDGIIELHADVSENELESIYGDLCNENRGGKEALRQDAASILRKEQWSCVTDIGKKYFSAVHSALRSCKQNMTHSGHGKGKEDEK